MEEQEQQKFLKKIQKGIVHICQISETRKMRKLYKKQGVEMWLPLQYHNNNKSNRIGTL